MKKILAICLTLVILSSGLTAFAGSIYVDQNQNGGGFGDNNVDIEDSLIDEIPEPTYSGPLYYNDFENCGAFTNSNVANDFAFADSGNATYGKALRAGRGREWASFVGSNHCGKYTWNGQQYTVFNEPLQQNKNYILAFDYKTENANQNFSLSFAPQVSDFFHSYDKNGIPDYRHNIPVSADWSTYVVKFNSDTATSINIKVNTLASTATTWIDNYGVYEAVKLTVIGMDADLNITKGVYTDGYVGIGSPLVASAPEGLIIKSAKMGGKDIDVVDGKLNIDQVKGAIEVKIASDLKSIRDNYTIKNSYIYVPKGQPVVTFIETALVNETYTLTNADGVAKSADGVIYPGDILTVKVSDTDSEVFGFKYVIDATGADNYVVSDVVYVLDCLLGKKEPQPEDDINRSGRLTVSDLVLVRHHILTANKRFDLDLEKLAAEKAKIVSDAASYGITEEMLAASVANMGNRSRVANVMKKALSGENITIATIGGSITEGTGISPADGRAEKCWAALMAAWWKRMFPGQVTFVNAGISGTNSNFGLHRLEADVLAHDPDLLFIEFAVNDGAQTGSMRSCHEALILKMLERGDAAIQMFFTTVGYNGGGGQLTYAPVGQHYDIPQISPRDAFWGRTFNNANGNTYDYSGITADGTHPNILGNAMVAVLTNNYLNSVYESLNDISTTSNAIPDTTVEDDTPNYMNWTGYDVGLMEEGVASSDGKVTVTDFGDFQKNTDSTSFRSNCDAMYGVKYTSGTLKPMVIDIDDCHIFGIFSHTATNGANVKVEVYKQGTNELLKTDSSVDTNYSGALRSHNASFESLEGVDVTIKIIPIITSGRTQANLRVFYIS